LDTWVLDEGTGGWGTQAEKKGTLGLNFSRPRHPNLEPPLRTFHGDRIHALIFSADYCRCQMSGNGFRNDSKNRMTGLDMFALPDRKCTATLQGYHY